MTIWSVCFSHLWSGGGLLDAPNFLEQGRLQDSYQRPYHLPGFLSWGFYHLPGFPSSPWFWITLPQKYGPLESEWDSQQETLSMLHKFQDFADKVSASCWIFHKYHVFFIDFATKSARTAYFRWTAIATVIATDMMPWFCCRGAMITKMWMWKKVWLKTHR